MASSGTSVVAVLVAVSLGLVPVFLPSRLVLVRGCSGALPEAVCRCLPRGETCSLRSPPQTDNQASSVKTVAASKATTSGRDDSNACGDGLACCCTFSSAGGLTIIKTKTDPPVSREVLPARNVVAVDVSFENVTLDALRVDSGLRFFADDAAAEASGPASGPRPKRAGFVRVEGEARVAEGDLLFANVAAAFRASLVLVRGDVVADGRSSLDVASDLVVEEGSIFHNGSLTVGGALRCPASAVEVLKTGDRVGRFACGPLEKNFGTISVLSGDSSVRENFGSVLDNLGSVVSNGGLVARSSGLVVSNEVRGFLGRVDAGGSVTSNYGTIGVLAEGVQLVSNFGVVYENRGTIVANRGRVVDTTSGFILNDLGHESEARGLGSLSML